LLGEGLADRIKPTVDGRVEDEDGPLHVAVGLYPNHRLSQICTDNIHMIGKR
jgi:hypothetical protein